VPRSYRSGDFGRFRSDGTLEFRGRRDKQVKFRGFRIEPAEIEWALERLPGVRQSAVVVRHDGSDPPRLLAYVVARPGATLDALPLSLHGKLDRTSLPLSSPQTSARNRVRPRTACEQIVAGGMADLLGVEEVGIEDEFFEAGGHSLLGLALLGRLSKVFGVEVQVRSLIENPTAFALAAIIELAHHDGSHRSLVRAAARAKRANHCRNPRVLLGKRPGSVVKPPAGTTRSARRSEWPLPRSGVASR
jgi:hypothetical protein